MKKINTVVRSSHTEKEKKECGTEEKLMGWRYM